MSFRVAVYDPLPVYRQGVLAALGRTPVDGETPDGETPDDLLAWARREDRRIVVFSICAPADWDVLADLCRTGPDVAVLAVLDDVTVTSYVRAISAGAAGAVPRNAAPAVLRAAFEAVVGGSTLLPLEVVRALRSPPGESDVSTSVDEPLANEKEWLRQLARGSSVARLAGQAGYSERMMFRLLRELYVRLGVNGRTAALMLARERGWV